MKFSGVGGQAVMEGVMMRNKDYYAVAVRKPDKEIEVKVSEYEGIIKNKRIRKIPVLRGMIAFVESLYLGMSTLMYSASFFEDEEESKESNSRESITKNDSLKESNSQGIMIAGTVIVSILLAVGLFFVLPYFISIFFEKFIKSNFFVVFLNFILKNLTF